MKTIWTNGCFDLLHAGHITFLQQAAGFGSVVVFLNSDESIRALKGEDRPVVPLAHRKKMLEAVRYVSRVVVFDGPNPVPVWEIAGRAPDLYIKDSECDVLNSEEGKWMMRKGVPITLLLRLPDISTSQIIGKIRG
jgi:D-beta-D-heptose 7-phosphate kinase/D-beta-D-heptose 1-phosphate adenosyltransferase